MKTTALILYESELYALKLALDYYFTNFIKDREFDIESEFGKEVISSFMPLLDQVTEVMDRMKYLQMSDELKSNL